MSNNVDLYYVHLFNDFSGSPRVLRDAIETQSVSPDNTYIITSKHKGFLDNANVNRINNFYARSHNRYIQLIYFFLSQITLFLTLLIFLFRGRINKRNSTVIINTMLPFGAALASKLMRAKIVYYIHETHIKPDLFKRFLRFFINFSSAHVIFVSKYLKSVEPFPKLHQTVIYNGLRGDFFNVKVNNMHLKFSEKKLFFAGSLKHYKGVDQLLDLARALPEFKVIAALNCDEVELKLFLEKRDLSDNVQFVARPKNIQHYFQSSFAVLNLSLPDAWIETFGLSLIEGMACGSPVVGPPVGGPAEFINDSNGLLIDSRKTNEIADFFRYLNSSEDIWKSFSENSLKSSYQFTASEYRKNFKSYLHKNNLI